MLKITGSLKTVTIDTSQVSKTVRDAVKASVEAAMPVYLQTLAETSSRYTGQTFATYNLIAKKFHLPLLPQTPVNEDAAHLEITAKYRKANLGSVTVKDIEGFYGVVFESNIEQIWSNEFGANILRSPPAKVLQPWHALEKAARAWGEAFKSHYLRHQPDFKDILSITEITVAEGLTNRQVLGPGTSKKVF
jgi:hypothetical protein